MNLAFRILPSFSRRMLGWCFTAFGRDAWCGRPDRLRGCSELLRTTLGRSFASVAWYAAWRRAPGWLCWLGGGWCCQLTFWVSMLCGVNSPAGQRDVEYKHLDATVENIPWMFLANSPHPLFVGRTSAKPYCLQCCHCCLRKRQRVYHEVAKKKQREIVGFRVWRISKKILQ